jgi:hypothetical protein
MNEYQRTEWLKMVKDAEDSLKGDCPLIEDEVTIAAAEDMQSMWNFIRYVANDYIELSHDKVRWQRDDYVKMAKKLLDDL